MDLTVAMAGLELLVQQPPVDGVTDVDVGVGVGGSALGSFVTTLAVGAIMVALAPAFVERTMTVVADEPAASFGYGLAVLLGLLVVSVLLAITGFGLLVVIPLLLIAVVVWAIGSVVAFLAIADRLLDRGDGWLVPLLVAAAINGGLTLTGVGGIVAFCIGAAGFGAVVRDLA